MSAPIIEDLEAAFVLAYRDASDHTRRSARFSHDRQLEHLATTTFEELA